MKKKKVFLVIGKGRLYKRLNENYIWEDRYLRTYNKKLAFDYVNKHCDSFDVIEFSKAIWIQMY